MDLRERQRRQRDEEYAQWYLKQAQNEADRDDPADDDPERQRPAKPSKFGLRQLEDGLRSGEINAEPIWYCRCSDKGQKLALQVKGMRRYVQRLGVNVTRRAFKEFVTGKTLDPAKRKELMRALEAARKGSGILVVAGTTRLFRSQSYDAHYAKNEKPTVAEFEEFMKLAKGVTIFTLNDPDADPDSDETFIRDKIIAPVKCRKPGRRPKRRPGDLKRRKLKWKKVVVKMYARLQQRGMGYRLVAEEMFRKHRVEISHQTVKRWVEEG
jgi:DNA invertase Pin-like site-specific DNA recombinase